MFLYDIIDKNTLLKLRLKKKYNTKLNELHAKKVKLLNVEKQLFEFITFTVIYSINVKI